MIFPHGLGISTASSKFAIANRLVKLTNAVDLSNKSILDVGCNDATYTIELARSADAVVGIDIESERISHANHRVKIQKVPVSLLLMSCEKLGFCDDVFDVVFINEVLEHIPDQDSALGEIYRVLKKQGLLVLFAPNRFYFMETHGARVGKRTFGRLIPLVHWLPRSIGRHFVNARSYTPRELRQLLVRHGFTVIHQSCLFPPLDGLRNRLRNYNLANVVDSYRRVIPIISRVPILRSMGLSIFIVAAKLKSSEQ